MGGGQDLIPSILKEVAPSSRAWKLAQEILPYLPEFMGAAAEPYIQQMCEKGIPEVRASFQAAVVGDLLETGKLDEAKALVAKLEKEFPGDSSVKEAQENLAAELLTAVGIAAPDFSLASLDNPKETFTTATFKGKYLLVDFWGTWCGWCVKELPTTHKVYAKFKDKGLEILSLASDKSPETVMDFRKKPNTPMPWKHAFLGRGENVDPVLKAYGVKGFPTLFLIGPDGKILAKGLDLREEGLEKTLSKFMK